MAADQFTQIANGLFRDARLSYRAKGIFGYISTHRSGWRVTLADLDRVGPDGRDVVRAGQKMIRPLRARAGLALDSADAGMSSSSDPGIGTPSLLPMKSDHHVS
ncbi:hypothetical protein [Streptomyces thinghirensis]|uniref:Transposase n=1 Tax=Streptomyces thinghirensis TaxID=551547 RepID=A0ABP9T3C2_9ACTN